MIGRIFIALAEPDQQHGNVRRRNAGDAPGLPDGARADVGQLLPCLEAQTGDGGIVRILRQQAETMDVRGRNLVTGLPKTVTVSSEETEEALREPTLQIVEAVHSVLEKTPPELAADVADRGIVLTGGGSLLRGLEELIEDRTGINTMTADEPMTCVAIGTGKFVEFLAGKRDED